MILELHERDAKVLEQILSILKNHPEIEKFEIDEEPMVSLPGLELFPSRRKVFRDRQEIQLTAKEYRILLLLATNKGRVLTYAQIYEQVWGDFTTGNENNTIVKLIHLRFLHLIVEADDADPQRGDDLLVTDLAGSAA